MIFRTSVENFDRSIFVRAYALTKKAANHCFFNNGLLLYIVFSLTAIPVTSLTLSHGFSLVNRQVVGKRCCLCVVKMLLL